MKKKKREEDGVRFIQVSCVRSPNIKTEQQADGDTNVWTRHSSAYWAASTRSNPIFLSPNIFSLFLIPYNRSNIQHNISANFHAEVYDDDDNDVG